MFTKKIKFDSSKFKNNDQENVVDNLLKLKIDFDADDPNSQIEQLNKNQILLKAAQNFFKEKAGEEQKPVKESIRVFNNFRIRSNSPQKQGHTNAQNLTLGQPIFQQQKEEKRVDLQSNSSMASSLLANLNMYNQGMKPDGINEISTSQLQQNNSKFQQSSRLVEPSQSPTRKLQEFKDMRDQAHLRLTNKQMKQNKDEVSHITKKQNKQEWILQQISRFSPQQVLKLDDPIILQAIQNLDLKVDDMKEWIQISDFYSIQESTRMQMRRYLTALNECFYKIESIIHERDRILQVKVKEINNQSARNKTEKFFQNYSNSKYYRDFDAQKSSSLGRNQFLWKSEDMKSDNVNSISINMGGDLQEASNYLQSNQLQNDESGLIESSKRLKNNEQHQKAAKQSQTLLSPQKLNQNSEGVIRQLKKQNTLTSIKDNPLLRPSISNQAKESYLYPPQSEGLVENHSQKIEEEVPSESEKQDLSNNLLNGKNNQSIYSIKQELTRKKFTKEDMEKKLEKKIKIEQRLTNLQISEALQFEEEQAKLQVALKKKKLLSNQRRKNEIQSKVEKVRERNNFIEERKNDLKEWKQEDENRRFLMIKQMQEQNNHLQSIKEKKEEIKQLMIYERNKQVQLKQQMTKDQQKINANELLKRTIEETHRIDNNIDYKNIKRESAMQNKQEKSKITNDQKAQIVYKQNQQHEIMQEQIAAEVAKKYDENTEFLHQLQRDRQLKIEEVNKDYERKQRENEERLQLIQTQEEQIKAEREKLLSTRISSSELQRKERIQNLKQQLQQTHMAKANKTMQSFYQTKQQFIERGEKYLKKANDNRDAYLEDVKTYDQYLKKSAAIRINKSFERQKIVSSPKQIKNIAQQIKSEQFKQIDHSF